MPRNSQLFPREHLNCIRLQLQRTQIVVKYNYLVLLLTVWGRNAALTSSCAFHYRDRIFLFANCNWDWINPLPRCWHAVPGVSYEVAFIRSLELYFPDYDGKSFNPEANQRQRNMSIDYLINGIITSWSVVCVLSKSKKRLPKNDNLCKIKYINRVRRPDLLMSFVWLMKSLPEINTII